MSTLTRKTSRDVQLFHGYGWAFAVPRAPQISETEIFLEVRREHILFYAVSRLAETSGCENGVSTLADAATQRGQWKLCPQRTAS